MTAAEVFDQFTQLGKVSRQDFLARLMMWNDLHLPDTGVVILTIDQYAHDTRGIQVPEIPELYEVAKQVCHSFGVPYRHPVTGKITPPPKNKRKS